MKYETSAARAGAHVDRRGFFFYSIIKTFNLGQQFYIQNDRNAISPGIGNLFEIDMGGARARERNAASRLCSLVNGTCTAENGLTETIGSILFCALYLEPFDPHYCVPQISDWTCYMDEFR